MLERNPVRNLIQSRPICVHIISLAKNYFEVFLIISTVVYIRLVYKKNKHGIIRLQQLVVPCFMYFLHLFLSFVHPFSRSKLANLRTNVQLVSNTFSKHKKYKELHVHEEFIHSADRWVQKQCWLSLSLSSPKIVFANVVKFMCARCIIKLTTSDFSK